MAVGQILGIFDGTMGQPPSTNYPTVIRRNNQIVLGFDAATAETVYFKNVLPSYYSGGNITVTISWIAQSATTGDTVFEAAIERQAIGTSIITDSFGTAKSGASTAPAANGTLQAITFTFTNIEADGVTAGDLYRLRIARLATNAGDTMTSDAQVSTVIIKEA